MVSSFVQGNFSDTADQMVPIRLFKQEQARRIQAERLLAEVENGFLAWENELFANKEFEAIDKLLIRNQRLVELTQKPQEVKGKPRWRVDIEETAEKVGASPSTVTRRTLKLNENAIMDRVEVPYVTKTGDEISLVWGKLVDAVEHPAMLKPETPRNHGGTRPKDKCEKCGWEMKVQDTALVSQETATCTNPDCRDKKIYAPRLTENGVKGNWEAVQDKQQGTITLRRKAEPMQVAKVEVKEHAPIEKPLPMQVAKVEVTEVAPEKLACPMSSPKDKQVALEEEADSPPTALSPSQLLAHAATYLVKVAGDEPMHGEMNMRDKEDAYLKYGYIYRTFGLQDARDHLIGKKTKAARILRADGKTYAQIWDADTDEDTEKVTLAAHLLTSSGVKVLLDEADAARGPHMWIFYNDLVDARSARRHVCEIAPMLADIKEYWPHHKQNVRLPGGKYVTPTVSDQCKLYDGYGALVASTGRETAAALLAYQNDARIVPDYPPDPEPEKPRKPQSVEKTPAPAGAQGDGPKVRDLVAFFNETHQLEGIHPLETRDHARAIWRAEKGRPSVSYLPDNRWYDHGHADQKTGDAFDLACLVWNMSKSQLLSDTRKEWLAVYGGRGLDDQAQPLTVKTERTVEERETLQGALSAEEKPLTLPSCQNETTPNEITTLCLERHLTIADPCEKCGCALQNHIGCARCYPLKGYHEYSEMVDQFYPRRIIFGGNHHAA